VQVTKALRHDGADNRPLIEETLSLPAEDILMIHIADGQATLLPNFFRRQCNGAICYSIYHRLV
jgi:hypothetical protein